MTQEYMQCTDFLNSIGYGWMIRLFSYKTENFDYILIASERKKDEDSHDEWGGMVKTIQKFIKVKNGQLFKTIAKLDNKINEVNSKIDDGFKQLKDLINEKSISD